MTSGGRRPELQDPQLLIAQLLETANQIDENELGGLARMHGWCQTLVETCTADGAPEGRRLDEQARALLAHLTALILGEVADAGRAFAQIVAEISALSKTLDAGTGDASSTATDEAVAQATPDGDSVEARLSRVFDSPIAADSPTGAALDSTPDHAAPATTTPPAVAPVTEEPPYEQEALALKAEELEFVRGFVEEACEHVEAIEAALLDVEAAPDDTAKINDLFRPFHTIKGMSGFLNLRDINGLTHEAETLLDQARKGQRQVTSGLIDVVFEVVDILKVQIADVGEWAAEPRGETVPQPPVCEMIDRLRALVSGRIAPVAREAGPGSGAQRTGENLVEQTSVPQAIVDFALERQRAGAESKPLGKTLLDMKAATPRQLSQAIRPQTQARSAATAWGPKALGDQSIRIDTTKLDALVDMVGELVIAQTLVNANPQVMNSPALTKDVGQVTKIVREIQEVALSMRMIPIGPTFQKMARLVRDVSRKAGKQVNLTISGEDTELDKTVIKQIGDPLVHMVRNAVDHGIESPAVRRATGKPESGAVHLGARHEGGSIVIEIGDDGRGLDPQALIRKGVEKGLVAPGEELTDPQAFALIFAAGFSTAEKVTDISGRGVGMDVVRRNIDQLRGKVEISSKKGQGSTFSIRLPLTLAIIDGMIIRVGGERFIIPTIAIAQSLRPRPEQITTVQQRGEMLNVRGRLVPLIQLGELFGSSTRLDPAEVMVVVAHCEGGQVGLVVEELIGQQQVVIKTLGERFEHVRGVSGAAILGDGRVGLILEIPGLATAHKEQTSTATRGRWLDHRVAVSSDAPGNEGDRGNARCSEADRLATTEEFAVPLRLDGG